MKLPEYIFPKYYSITLIKNNNKKLPELGLYENFERYDFFNVIESKINDFEIERSKKYKERLERLTPDQEKEYGIRIFDFTSNKNFDRKLQTRINEKGNFSNAWRKMYELCKREKLIPHTETVKHFDICSMPGAFILAINHFIKTERRGTKYNWYGQSFITSGKKKYFGDKFGLYKRNNNRILIGVGGDITNPDNIEYYRYFFRNKKRNLITSDCGLGGTETENYTRENQMIKIFLGQFICGICVLERGGNFLMKFYDFFSTFYLSFVHLMSYFFKEVKLIKPESSRQPRGHEIYLGCFSFRDNLTEEYKNQMISIMKNINIKKDIRYSMIGSFDEKENLSLQKGLSYYYSDMLERDKKERKYTEELINSDIYEDTETYIEIKKELTEIFRPNVINYLRDYTRKMDYKIISNKDKI